MATRKIGALSGAGLLAILLVVVLLSVLSNTQPVSADNEPIMGEYPGEGSTVGVGQPTEDIYATNTVTFEYNGGDVYISSCPETLCAWSVDDAVDLTITHPDQSQDYRRFTSYTQYLYGLK